MTPKLKEKIMTNREPITDTIIRAKWEMGSPMIMARLRIFRYTSYFFILDHNSDEVGKDAHNGPGNQDKDQDPGDAFFQIGVLAEEVSSIEQETY